MLKTKHRFLILASIALSVAAASLVNQIAVYLDINPKDPLYFAEQNSATFQYNDGLLPNKTLIFSVAEITPSWTNVTIEIDSIEWIPMTSEGFLNGTDRYTIFWLHVPNPLISGNFGITIGRVFNVTDPVGLIGEKGINYTAIVNRKLVLWPLTPGLHGAQYAFEVTFYNASNNAVIAQGIYDSTCGMLFELKGGSPYIQLDLLQTNYPISRNRMASWPWALGLSAGVTIVAYILMKKKWELEEDKINEIILLMGAGVAVCMVDVYVDVWLYAIFGFMGNILLHLSVAFGLLAICFYQRYKIKWTIPAFLEVAFILPMTLFMGDPYVPHLTAFMGLVITWLMMIYISGHPKQPKSETKIGEFISEFV
jgi:hypothetical protein